MFKHVFAGATALALVAGASFAQDQNTTEKQQTVIQNPDGSQTVDKTKTERNMNDDGSQNVETHHSTRNTDAFGNQSVTKKTTNTDRDSDGSVHQETTTDTHKGD
jgi:hypothetical protein